MIYSWLLLHYKVPREPTASRVYVWRKLKRMGALLLHDALWVLPNNPRTLEQFQWLAAEIGELEGEATLWESRLAPGGTGEESLINQFQAQVDEAYSEILNQLEHKQVGEPHLESELDLAGLSRRYQQLIRTDYFHSPLGQRVRQALETIREKGEVGGNKQ